MARKVRDAQLGNRTNRLSLPPRAKPYWRALESGLHLGYRRPKTGSGAWIMRRFLGEGRYDEAGIGRADDYENANGKTVFSYDGAQTIAREKARTAKHQELGIQPDTGPARLPTRSETTSRRESIADQRASETTAGRPKRGYCRNSALSGLIA